MKTEELCSLSIGDLSELFRKGEVSPVEATQACLERIERDDGKLNSFITLLKAESLESALHAERAIRSGNYLGPLHGVTVGLKDLFHTRGMRTTGGSKILQSFVPNEDASVVELLKGAGAVIIGKLNMHEFAYGVTNDNPHFGPSRNPWNLECITGGSSGGSCAAVSAGLCAGALGSDTGGSIRIPSSLCGVVGLKPTYGRVSKHGVLPLSWSMDHVGPIARHVKDAALMMNVMAGYDPRDPASSTEPALDFTYGLDEGVKGLRMGIIKNYFFDVIDREVKEAVLHACKVLEGLGADVEEVNLPELEHSRSISSTIVGAEAAAYHESNFKARPQDYGDDVRARLEVAYLLRATDYVKAQRFRALFVEKMAQLMKRVDLLLTPTCPIEAPKIGVQRVAVGGETQPVLNLLLRLTSPFNLTGMPAISIPCGFTSRGLPIGLQIAGRPFEEVKVLKAANAYEVHTEWHKRRPSL